MSDLDYKPPEPAPPLGGPGLASETWDTSTPAGAPGLDFETGDASAPAGAGAPDLDFETGDTPAPVDLPPDQLAQPTELFQSWSLPEPTSPMRIPHLGHLCLLTALLLIGLTCMMVVMLIAVHFHFDGVSNLDQIKDNVHYLLGSEVILYLVTFSLALFLFPLFWNKSFFAGIQWRGAKALQLGWRLPAVAVGCIVLAAIDNQLLPGPSNAPIDDIFRTPGAAWLMFAFGVTFAPFFEEIAFRGFLLPALATAWDWTIEKSTGKPTPPLDENGHPQWSILAMVIASIATSLPFALLHAEQTSWSLGPFLLLVVISLVLCAVRLATRSLAASTLVHASYNFILFSTALISSSGFRHLDKM